MSFAKLLFAKSGNPTLAKAGEDVDLEGTPGLLLWFRYYSISSWSRW